jgi:hypothetical protein
MLGLDNVQNLGKGVDGDCVCSCEVCKPNVDNVNLQSYDVHLSQFCGVIALWTSILCSKGELDMFHKRVCLMGECLDCGVEKLKLCPSENTTE